MNKNCIMLEVNKKNFFTNKKVLKEIKAFIKNFNVKVWVVEVTENVVLNLDKLSDAIATNEGQKTNYKIIKELKI